MVTPTIWNATLPPKRKCTNLFVYFSPLGFCELRNAVLSFKQTNNFYFLRWLTDFCKPFVCCFDAYYTFFPHQILDLFKFINVYYQVWWWRWRRKRRRRSSVLPGEIFICNITEWGIEKKEKRETMKRFTKTKRVDIISTSMCQKKERKRQKRLWFVSIASDQNGYLPTTENEINVNNRG